MCNTTDPVRLPSELIGPQIIRHIATAENRNIRTGVHEYMYNHGHADRPIANRGKAAYFQGGEHLSKFGRDATVWRSHIPPKLNNPNGRKLGQAESRRRHPHDRHEPAKRVVRTEATSQGV
ncbi:hypothetical protein [Pseudoclavibacter sp. VKM Ac-2867]|uniref:hypothetical protein n=1 Tax=Pseudoclavibacter sp. VKM Ac-2867 TaxID=2783829 RepID=UPI00188B8382|nr:hypothetical protein [Pseudoclavibacter sp. VKM Ac-2867]MBF4460528.1 hypothetical protein [Pseudoclavibacter sp. VKM Ac-2867]